MMTDIFSSFDPATSNIHYLSPSFFWLMTFISMSTIAASIWALPSRMSWVPFIPSSMMNEQTSRTFSVHLKGLTLILTSLFLILISLNMLGLLPYVFSTSGHLFFTLSFGLPLWLSLILSGAMHNPKAFTAHFLPSGAPDWLNPFLVLIETVSISVRFITLSFRLAANITAGHIVLGLMGIYASSALMSSLSSSITLLSIQAFFTAFEIGVGLIQAYIFCLLLTLYSEDHPSSS
uniref:ATP synthase subunit a n=1 Tax=Euthalenessa festiva TaxID=2153328 RepID=A0A343W6K0_9ANNE|nr:ATP synthase F0 subunit 6 [Euthalenessa festiva]